MEFVLVVKKGFENQAKKLIPKEYKLKPLKKHPGGSFAFSFEADSVESKVKIDLLMNQNSIPWGSAPFDRYDTLIKNKIQIF